MPVREVLLKHTDADYLDRIFSSNSCLSRETGYSGCLRSCCWILKIRFGIWIFMDLDVSYLNVRILDDEKAKID